MSKCLHFLVCLAVFPTVVGAQDGDDSLVAAHGDISISTYDIARYAEFNLAPEARVSGLARERAIKQIVENLYVLRRAEQAEGEVGILTSERLAWVAEYERTRYAAIRYFDYARSDQVLDIDWEEQARELYAATPENFSTGEQIDVSHILIKTEGKTFDEWVALITAVRAELADGVPFDAVAIKYSEDSGSAQKGGSLGLRSKGQLVEAFEEAAFAMTNPGDISDPVMTQFGVHIIKLNGREPAIIRPFASVQRRLEAQAQERARKELKDRATLPFKQEIGPAIRDIDEDAVRAAVLPLINTEW